MTAKAKALGLKNTRFHDPTGLSTENVSTPRETIAMLKAVMNHPVLGPITHRLEYEAHPVGKPPITYNNTYRPAVRPNIQVLGGKTGYNDDARYCLVIATKIDGRTYYMSFLSNEGKLTRFGDVARVADWVVLRRKTVPAGVPVPAKSTTTLVSTHAPARPRAPATGGVEPTAESAQPDESPPRRIARPAEPTPAPAPAPAAPVARRPRAGLDGSATGACRSVWRRPRRRRPRPRYAERCRQRRSSRSGRAAIEERERQTEVPPSTSPPVLIRPS